ncbi:hypothetical protein [Nocardioides sambongensis]|uniref:hypothetical protein n=1 Tax=Nocardioides sambongensis TaxID=2589074 RepID=UPI001127C599|nr:hypothetical protein [Nocardioides sambongensis]
MVLGVDGSFFVVVEPGVVDLEVEVVVPGGDLQAADVDGELGVAGCVVEDREDEVGDGGLGGAGTGERRAGVADRSRESLTDFLKLGGVELVLAGGPEVGELDLWDGPSDPVGRVGRVFTASLCALWELCVPVMLRAP